MNEQPPRAARRRLIDELQSLSASLGDGRSAAAPTSVPPSPTNTPPLLDLGAIFEEGELFNDDEAPLLFWPLQELIGSPAGPLTPATDRNALIEQIVDRLLPDLEQQLRDQLRGLDVDHLQRLLR